MTVSAARRVLSRCVGAHEIRYFLMCDQVNRTEMNDGLSGTASAIEVRRSTRIRYFLMFG